MLYPQSATPVSSPAFGDGTVLVAVVIAIALLLPSGATLSLFCVHLVTILIMVVEYSKPVTSFGIVVEVRRCLGKLVVVLIAFGFEDCVSYDVLALVHQRPAML